jgi:DNA adenine methylase
MNTPIKYFGGKGTMFKNIIKYFPVIGSYDTYVEPFSGSFSIGLKKDITPIEIYNDLDKNVYSLYKVISDKDLFEQFKQKCDLTYYCADLRTEFKELLKNPELNLVDRAFYFFVVNRLSHNGIGGISVNTVIRRNMSKSVSDFLSSVDRLPELHQRLSNLIVLNTDGIELIKKYDRENVLQFLDPPYMQSTRTSYRYNCDLDYDGHIRFLDVILNVKKAKLLICGYDCELYDVLIKNNFKKQQFIVNTVDGNRTPKTKTETIWYNYNI